MQRNGRLAEKAARYESMRQRIDELALRWANASADDDREHDRAYAAFWKAVELYRQQGAKIEPANEPLEKPKKT